MVQNLTLPVGTGFRIFGQLWTTERPCIHGNILQEETKAFRKEEFWSQHNLCRIMTKMKTDSYLKESQVLQLFRVIPLIMFF